MHANAYKRIDQCGVPWLKTFMSGSGPFLWARFHILDAVTHYYRFTYTILSTLYTIIVSVSVLTVAVERVRVTNYWQKSHHDK
jgi:hypothetical protein